MAGLSLALAACLLLPGHAPGAAGKKIPKMNAHPTPPGHEAVAWSHPAHGLRLGLSAEGATVRLSLENVGHSPLEVFSHVEAGEDQYDWYTIHLRDAHGHSRTLAFVADRDESARITAHLDAGGRLTNTIDLAAWAQQPINGDQPLAPGAYEADAAYEVPPSAAEKCWTGRLEAGPAKFTVPNH